MHNVCSNCGLCQILSCGVSVVLFMSGFVQVFVTGIYILPLDFIHLVFQILAGIWSMFTGVLCLASSWRQNTSVMNSPRQIVSVFLNFVLQILATSLLLLDEAGISVSIKHYLPNLKMPSADGVKMQSKDLMFLTGSGSLSIFMGMIILITNLRRFQRKRYPEEENVVVLSARWVFQERAEALLKHDNIENCNSATDLQIGKISQEFGEKLEKISNGLDINESCPSNAKELQRHKINNQESAPSRPINKPTYVRCCIVDDIPEEDFVGFDEADDTRTVTPVSEVHKIIIAPRRSPIEVHPPAPPNTFGNRRVLATPFSSSSIFSIPDSITGRVIRCGTHTSFGSSSTYYRANSQVISDSSSGNRTQLSSSSNYQSFSISPDSMQQSFSKEQDSVFISFSNSRPIEDKNQPLIKFSSSLYESYSNSKSPDRLNQSLSSLKSSATQSFFN